MPLHKRFIPNASIAIWICIEERSLIQKHVRNTQFTFKGFEKPKDAFGGSQFATRNPKTKRPLHSKFPLHLVLRGKKGGLRNPIVFNRINAAIVTANKKYGHRMYDYANAGNHIHASLKLSRIQNWPAYIRELTSEIVKILRAAGLLGPNEKFFLYRPFTRIVRGWRKAYLALKEYIQLNAFEVENGLSREEARRLRAFRRQFMSDA